MVELISFKKLFQGCILSFLLEIVSDIAQTLDTGVWIDKTMK